MKNNWYPSHIDATKRALLDNLKLCDTIIEVIDARAPFATKNRELKSAVAGKNKILVLNKIDLVPEKIVEQLEKHFKKSYLNVVAISAKDGKNIKRLFQTLNLIYRSKAKKLARKKINPFPIRVMVIGMPNVGKSKIINSLTGRKIAGVADRPGFTRGKQWIKILPNVELLDMPGILWVESADWRKLLIIGSSKEDSNNIEEAARHLVDIISKAPLEKAYNIEIEGDVIDTLSKHFKLDEVELSRKIIRDFRSGKLGKLSLESA